MKAKTIAFTGVNQMALQPVEIPAPGAGEVLLKAGAANKTTDKSR